MKPAIIRDKENYPHQNQYAQNIQRTLYAKKTDSELPDKLKGCFYNSEEEHEVEQVLAHSNRLMQESAPTSTVTTAQQSAREEYSQRATAAFLNDTTVVRHNETTEISENLVTHESNASTAMHSSIQQQLVPMQVMSLDETDQYPQGRVKNMVSVIEDDSQLEIIGHDGKSMNGATSSVQEQAFHLHQMYLREKPLLEKIQNMRVEQDHHRMQMDKILQENEQLKHSLKVQQMGEGTKKLKTMIKQLQGEVKYLTKINHAQQDKISKFDELITKKGNITARSKKSMHSSRSQNKLSVDERMRDCCVQKFNAVERETIQQQQRIFNKSRGQSPLNSTQRVYSSNNRNTNRSKTPSKRGKGSTLSSNTFQFDPLPSYSQSSLEQKHGSLYQSETLDENPRFR